MVVAQSAPVRPLFAAGSGDTGHDRGGLRLRRCEFEIRRRSASRPSAIGHHAVAARRVVEDRPSAKLGVGGPPMVVPSNLPASRSGAGAAEEVRCAGAGRAFPRRRERGPIGCRSCRAARRGRSDKIHHQAASAAGHPCNTEKGETEVPWTDVALFRATARHPEGPRQGSRGPFVCRPLEWVTGLPTSSSLARFSPSAEALRHFAPG